MALVAVGGVNLALLLYLVWNDRNANRKATQRLELQLTKIKVSVSSVSKEKWVYEI